MTCLSDERIAELEAEAADLELLIPALVAGSAAAAAEGISSFSLDTGISKQTTKYYGLMEVAATLRQWRSRLALINRKLTGTSFTSTSLRRFGE